MPLISIIIPVYNAAQHLTKCLNSIQRQTISDYEVLLVDDGSTDRSADIYMDYAANNPRFRYIYKENGGVSSARNTGIKAARGKYMSFIDADDWVDDNYLSTILQTGDGTELAEIVFFGATAHNKDATQKKYICNSCYATSRDEVEDAIFQLRNGGENDVLGWAWNKVFHTDIIRRYNILFCEEIGFREDEIFTLEYCRYINSLQVICTSVYNYRIVSGGLTFQGMKGTDYLPSSIQMEESISYYSHEKLREHLIHSITSYRAIDIYKSPMKLIYQKLKDYAALTERLPQPGKECRPNNLTKYLQHGFWAGYLYCLIRKL